MVENVVDDAFNCSQNSCKLYDNTQLHISIKDTTTSSAKFDPKLCWKHILLAR